MEVTMYPTRYVLSLLCGLTLLANPAASQTEISFAHAGTPGTILDLTAQQFAELANSRLGERAKIVVYGSEQLGNDREVLEKLKEGTVDLALAGSVMSSAVPLFGLFDMPYLVRDRDHAARVRDEVVMPLMAPKAEDAGYRILAMWENGFRHVTNNTLPIVTPEDLNGLKLRVPQGVWREKMFRAYGADAKPLPFAEVRAALENQEIDGQENPFAIIYPFGIHEVQTYLSLTGHVYTPAFLTAGASWSGLDPEIQKIVTDAARQTQDVALRLGEELDQQFLDLLGVTGIQINEVDKDAFVAASETIYREFAEQVPEGGMLIDKVLALRKGP
jgi:TRAP-type transport system periplasmic protein